MSVWFSGRRYTIALSSCLQASWNCLSCWNVTLSANITFSSGDLPMPGASVLATHYKSHVNLTVHPGTALEVDINPLIILSFLFCTHISFSTEYNGWLDILLPLCTNTKLQCSLSLVQATGGLRNPHLLTPFHFICFILINNKRKGYLINIVPVLW